MTHLDPQFDKLVAEQNPAIGEELRHSAAMDLVARLMLGVYVYPILFIILAFATPFRADHGVIFWSALCTCISSMLVRSVIALKRETFYRDSPQLFYRVMFGSIWIVSAWTGIIYLCSVRFYGLESWTFAIVMMFMVGIASGSTISMTPNFKLLAIHISLVFGPTTVQAFFMGGKEGNMFAIATLVLIVFLFLQGHRLHEVYWSILRDRATEASRTMELEAARVAAVAASASKSGFLANMSHEIRTPMHGILGMAQLALDADTQEETKEYLRTLRHSASGLLTVLNDILDFSKVEAGKVVLEKTPFALRDLLAETESVLSTQANAKGLTLKCRAFPEVPEFIVGDSARLRQILINLIGNAVKFTHQGSITLEVSCEPSNERVSRSHTLEGNESGGGAMARVNFRVIDTGIGIPADQQKLIFEAFSQADESVTRKFGGTGLGLSICSQLVQLMGGELTVTSVYGKGSTFQFTCNFKVALALAPVVKAEIAEEADVTPMRILLAEDNPVSQKLATKLLTREGHDVRVVGTGTAAIAAWEAEDFDVILMDNLMPEMDGVEAVQEIRSRESAGRRRRTPIIACSASVMATDLKRFLAAGMDDNLSKPFCADDLYKVLRNYSPPSVRQ